MVNYNLPLFQHPQPVWDQKKCEKLAKRWKRDGLGTKNSLKGMLYNHEIGGHNGDLINRYNGGCVRNGVWYQGEEFQLPKVPNNFEIVYVQTWGWRIIKK